MFKGITKNLDKVLNPYHDNYVVNRTQANNTSYATQYSDTNLDCDKVRVILSQEGNLGYMMNVKVFLDGNEVLSRQIHSATDNKHIAEEFTNTRNKTLEIKGYVTNSASASQIYIEKYTKKV